jgi:hypothetical protein
MGLVFSSLFGPLSIHNKENQQHTHPSHSQTSRLVTKIRHYRQNYLNQGDPIDFMSLTLDTSGRIYHDLNRLQILHSHRATSELANEFTEESGQFRFLRVTCLTIIKGSVGLILTKVSDMRISIPLDLSSRSLYSITVLHLLQRSIGLYTLHSFSLVSFILGFRLFYSVSNSSFSTSLCYLCVVLNHEVPDVEICA